MFCARSALNIRLRGRRSPHPAPFEIFWIIGAVSSAMVDTVRSFGGFRSKNDAGISPSVVVLCCPILLLCYAAPGSVLFLTHQARLGHRRSSRRGRDLVVERSNQTDLFCVFAMNESRSL